MASRRLLLGGVLAAFIIIGGLTAVYSAQQRALHAEETYVAAQLETASCLDDWGANEGAATAHAAATGVTPLGIRVAVQLPYAYRVETDGEPTFADTASQAVYDVTLFGIRRVSGDEITPC